MVLAAQPFSPSLFEPVSTTKASGTTDELFAASLQEFLEVALKMAQIDEAVATSKSNTPSPEDSEARKWHEVSLRALEWTRSSVLAQQGSALGQLKELAGGAKASLSIESTLRAEAVPFAPAASKKMTPAKQISPTQAGALVASGAQSVGSLRDDLEKLREYDPKQCLIVRRIKRLGLESPTLLREHLNHFGEVAEILVAHSFEKKSAKCRADRLRPAALGFVVMSSVESAEAVLRGGATHMIGGIDINVKAFSAFEDLDKNAGGHDDAVALANFQ
jgi:hypothetical protein